MLGVSLRCTYLEWRQVDSVEIHLCFVRRRVDLCLDDQRERSLDLLEVRIHADRRCARALDEFDGEAIERGEGATYVGWSQKAEKRDDQALIDLHGELLDENAEVLELHDVRSAGLRLVDAQLYERFVGVVSACCLRYDRMEHHWEHGVLLLIVDLQAVDADVQRRVRHGPGVFDPETVEGLSLGMLATTFGVDHRGRVFLKDDFLQGSKGMLVRARSSARTR